MEEVLLEGLEITQNSDGKYVVSWRGSPMSTPRDTPDEAYALAKSYSRRWNSYTLDILAAVHPGIKSSTPRRAGLFRWTLKDGREGVLFAGGLSSAKALLKEQLEVSRLPWGTRWERV